jgi:hypothetical protein
MYMSNIFMPTTKKCAANKRQKWKWPLAPAAIN